MSDSVFLTDGNGTITGLVDTNYTGELVIPEYIASERITSIGESAFRDCFGLTYVVIPDSVISIGVEAFRGTDITSVIIPNSITSIDDGTFLFCVSLKSVTIPNSVTSIGLSAFEGCTNLTSITIPNSVASIGEAAFAGCSSLISVTIPYSVTSVGAAAFLDCSNLTSVAIPNSVVSVGEVAFEGCSSLTTVYVANPNNLSAAVGSYDWSNTGSTVAFVLDPREVDYLIKAGTIMNLADKIRVLSGTEDVMTPDEMDANLNTANKEVSNQVDIIAQIIEALNLLPTFTIVGVAGYDMEDCTYQFKKGMTWNEWVESKYNTDGIYIDGDPTYNYAHYIRTADGYVVQSAFAMEEIIEGEYYLADW